MIVFPRINFRGSKIRNTSQANSNDRFSSDNCSGGPKFGTPLKLKVMIVFPRINFRGSKIRNTSQANSNDRFSSDNCSGGPKFGTPLKLKVMIVFPRIIVERVRNSEHLSS